MPYVLVASQEGSVHTMKIGFHTTAQSLGLPEKTLERWIRQGRIPVQREGDFCVFSRSTLEKWAVQRKLSFAMPEESEPASPAMQPESLCAAMQHGEFVYDVSGQDVHTVLTAAVEHMDFVPAEIKDKLIRRLLAREELSSTGIGKGVAIPHPRTPLANAFETAAITTCFLKEPVDFGAVDDRPVFVMFLILSPDVKIHLNLLSRLAYCLRNDAFVSFLKSTPDAKQVLEKIAEFEIQLDGKDGP